MASQNIPAKDVPAYIRQTFGVSVALNTLNKLRSVGGGPEYRKFGRKVVYAARDLDEWVSARLSAPMASTSDESHG